MTNLRIFTRFALRGVWIHPGALGQRFTWDIDGWTATLALPRDQKDYVSDEEPEVPPVPAWVPTARIEDSGDAVSVQIVGVEVEFSGPLSAADKETAVAARDRGNEKPLDDFVRAAQSLWEEGNQVAQRVAHAWLAQVRVVSGQPWLGIAVEPPVQYGRSHITDREADVRLMSYGPLQTASIRSGQLALSADELSEIQRLVAAQQEPPVAESLLADARYLAQEAGVVDSQRAVVIAVAACEIKAKSTMRERVDASRSELLDLVIGRISNLPQLLDRPLKGALGTSLKEADKGLYERTARLSQLRNQVVHRGIEVNQKEGWQLVVAAGELFAWLDGL